MIRRLAAASAALALAAGAAHAYPLDGRDETGIQRLEAYRLGQQGLAKHGDRLLPPGALLPTSAIRLSLLAYPELEIPPADPELSARLRAILGSDAPAYSVALLDLTDPANPRYASVNPDKAQIPGSVGKIMVALALFQQLADLYPDDLDARRRLLRSTVVTADEFIRVDDHKVPFWKPGAERIDVRPIEEGDRGNLWTWLDWMLSSSSNAAGSEMLAQVMLMERFGREYPVAPEQARAFFAKTPKGELSSLLSKALLEPIRRSGLDRSKLQQGSFFTRQGKATVPGAGSTATAGELLRYMVRMEQGRLVDGFSSLELKRLLYLTEQRVRYASQPALEDSALYFKSGSLYSCMPEKGFTCTKYHGNRQNLMNSVVLVETFDRKPALRYAVAVLSNVLRKDSSALHSELALEIHRMLEAMHPSQP